jgi:hypothetical protein
MSRFTFITPPAEGDRREQFSRMLPNSIDYMPLRVRRRGGGGVFVFAGTMFGQRSRESAFGPGER